jgi:prepilin peptidase CpaA
MTWRMLVIFAPLLAVLSLAAAEDVRTRRIPNWLTLFLAVTGLLQSLTPHGTVSLSQSLAGLLVGGTLNLLFYLLNARGGGDVKLLAGAGAWLGALLVLEVFLAAAVVGMLLVLAQCAIQGKLPQLLKNTAAVAASLLNVRKLGVAHLHETLMSSRTVRKPLPHAVPVLLATVLILLAGGWML